MILQKVQGSRSSNSLIDHLGTQFVLITGAAVKHFLINMSLMIGMQTIIDFGKKCSLVVSSVIIAFFKFNFFCHNLFLLLSASCAVHTGVFNTLNLFLLGICNSVTFGSISILAGLLKKFFFAHRSSLRGSKFTLFSFFLQSF